jgi:hypothetical protein
MTCRTCIGFTYRNAVEKDQDTGSGPRTTPDYHVTPPVDADDIELRHVVWLNKRIGFRHRSTLRFNGLSVARRHVVWLNKRIGFSQRLDNSYSDTFRDIPVVNLYGSHSGGDHEPYSGDGARNNDRTVP